MNKFSTVEAGQVMKLAAGSLRALSEENMELKEKVASFEKLARAERIATEMQEKNLQPDLDFKSKVAGLLERDDLEVVERAVELNAPQTKFASIHDDSVKVEGGLSDQEGSQAESTFAANLASLD